MRKLILFALLSVCLFSCTKKAPYADIALGDDIQGPVLRYAIFGFEDDNTSYTKKYNLRFDTTGVLLEDNFFYYDREQYNDEGERTDYAVLVRDDKGRIIRGEHYLNGDMSTATYAYDKLNRVVREDFRSGIDSTYRLSRNVYGEDGHIAYRITERRNADCSEYTTDSLVFTLTELDERGNWTTRTTDCYFTTTSENDGVKHTTRTNVTRTEYRFIQYYDEPDPLYSGIVSASSRTFSRTFYDQFDKQYTQVDIHVDFPDSLLKGDRDKLETALARTIFPYNASGNTLEKRLESCTRYGEPVSKLPDGYKGKLLHYNIELLLSHHNGDLITYFVNDQTIAREVKYSRDLPHYINFDTRNNELVRFQDLIADRKSDIATGVLRSELNRHNRNTNYLWSYMCGDFYFNSHDITVFGGNEDLTGIKIDMSDILLALGNRGRRFLAPYLVRYHEVSDGQSFIPYGMHMDTRAFSLMTDNQLFVKMPYDGTILVEEHEINPDLPMIQTWEGTVAPTGDTYGDNMRVYKYHMVSRNIYRGNVLHTTRSCDCYGQFAIGSDGDFILLNSRADHCGNNFDFAGCSQGKVLSAGEDGTVG